MTPEELEKQIKAEEEAQRVSEGLPAGASHLKNGKTIWDGGSGSPAANDSGTTTPAANDGGSPQGYDNIIKYLQEQREALKIENDEQRKLRERKERSQGIVSGISDLGRAIANMYYTTQGAPNGYDDKNSLSAKHQAKLEKQRKEREANSDRYLQYLLREKQLLDEGRNAGLAARKQNLAEQKQRADIEQQKELIKLKQEQLAHDKAELAAKEKYWADTTGIRQQDANTRSKNATTNETRARNNSSKGGSGSGKQDNIRTKVITRDEFGNIIEEEVVTDYREVEGNDKKERYPFKSK